MTFEEYENEAVKTAIYPGRGTALGLCYVALKMNGEAGEFSEHVGKAIRDEHFMEVWGDDRSEFGVNSDLQRTLTPEKRELLIKEIGDVLWYLAAGAAELGTDLATIAKGNIDKLRDRKERGKLGGSGDNR